MPSRKEAIGWRQSWRYVGEVFAEAGWPPVWDWVTAVVTGAIGAGVESKVKGDWSWLVAVGVGVSMGVIVYCLGLIRASIRLNARQKDRLELLASRVSELEAQLNSRWNNDDILSWNVDFMGTSNDGGFAWDVWIRTKKDFQPIRLRILTSVPVVEVEAEHRTSIDHWEERLEATILQEPLGVQLSSGAQFPFHGEVLARLNTDRDHPSLEVMDVQRYRS